MVEFFLDEETPVSNDSGQFFIDDSPAPVVSPDVSWGQAAKYVGKNILAGAGDLLGMGADVASPTLMGTPNQPSKLINAFLAPYTNAPTLDETGQFEVGGNAAKVIGAGARASLFPEAPIANALIGASTKAGEVLNPENPLLGSLLGLAAGVGGTSIANSVSNTVRNAGKAFERSSIGAQGKNYVKSLKVNGLIDDAETGDLSTRLAQAIDEVSNKQGFGLLRDPERLATRNQAILDEAGTKIGEGLKAADAVGAKPLIDFNNPSSNVGKLIANAKSQKGPVRDAVDEFKAIFYDPIDGWNGTVSELNNWKTSVGELGFSGSAKGTLPPQLARKVQRAIRADLMDAINDSVAKSGVVDPVEWSTIMRDYSNASELAPIFNEGVARGLGSTLDKTARGLLRTSGGTLTTPTIIGGLVAGNAAGAPIGLATGAGLALLGTPTGQGITGNVLKAAGKAGARLTDSSLATKLAAGASQISLPKEIATPQVSIKDVRSAITKVAENLPTQQKQEKQMLDSALNRGESKLKESDKTPAIKKVEAKIDADPVDSAIYEAESGRDPEAKNPVSSASGAFQLTKGTAKALGVKDVFDIEDNYQGYQKLRAEHEARFGSNPAVLYAAHYLGATVLDKVIKGKPLTKTESEQVAYLKAKALPRFEKIYKKKEKETEYYNKLILEGYTPENAKYEVAQVMSGKIKNPKVTSV